MLVLGFLGLVCLSRAFSITKCKGEDSECMKQSAQAFLPTLAAGIPEFGTKSLDPLYIDKVDKTSSYLNFVSSDLVVTGMKNCTVDHVSRKLATNEMFVGIMCSVDVQAHYDLKGKVLFLPVEGNGHISVQLYKILINVESVLGEAERNGQKYWTIKKWHYTFDLKDTARIELKNLFGATEEMSKALRDMAGERANDIIKEVGPPIVTAITTEVVEAIRLLYNHIPLSELVLS